MTTEHTPTPRYTIKLEGEFATLFDKLGYVALQCNSANAPRLGAIAVKLNDAERAVNAHDALVSALKTARYAVEGRFNDHGCDAYRLDLEKVDAALTLAGVL